MRRIVKGAEPAFLTEYRMRTGNPRPTYADFFDKPLLRITLVKRQAGLCCFCQRALPHDGEGVKVAHLRPQSTNPHLDLTWWNLWAACDGHEGMPPSEQHCDTRQGPRECPLDPAAIVDTQFVYKTDGTIRHVEDASNDAMNEILNLNCRRLAATRKQRLSGFIQALSARHKGPWTTEVVERELRRLAPLEGERAPELVGMLRYWLGRKRTSRAS